MLYNSFGQQQQLTSDHIPVTHLPFNDDSSKLQFAIISDVWGGRRPGIFEDAVVKLGLLSPQFVISVGDLIDGKSYDSIAINQQWDEFDRDIQPLGMPFFYVPGNHDIGNPLMEKAWRKRMGSPYYHFVYKDVLFLVINTEDGGHGGIKDEQVNYFKKVIKEHTDVRWTFLFMHRPVWQGKDDKQEGYEQIEAFLKGRNYSLFSGHHHTYLSVLKNGQRHYVLGSTGGGSDLRGEKFGEFDHITLVSFTSGEPKVVNLKLDGVIKEDVVNEDSHTITSTLIDEKWMEAVALVNDHQQEKLIAAEIAFDNPTNYPLRVDGSLDSLAGYTISPASIELLIPPKSKVVQQIKIVKKDGSLIDLGGLPSIDLSLNGTYNLNGIPYSLPARKKLLLSWKMIPKKLDKYKPASSTDFFLLKDTSSMIYLTSPEYLNGPWYWSGSSDALLRFKVVRDDNYFYVDAIINDDQWINDPGTAKDILYLHLEDTAGGQNYFGLSTVDNKLSKEGTGTILLKDIVFSKFSKNGLLMIEFKVPIHKVLKNDNTMRLNIGYRDQDNNPEKWVSTLFWKPLWNSAGDYKNSGVFLVQ